MEQQLQLFSERLAPPEEWERLAKEKIALVFEHIKRNSRLCTVDRCEIVGGMAKKTSTCIKVDVDTIIYYNDDSGMIKLEDILTDWEEILLLKTNMKGEDIHHGKKLLTFRFDEVPIDLVAVRNKVTSNYNANVEKMQMCKELDDAKRKGEVIGKDLTLSGANLEWMKRRDKISHDIARLGKYWTQTILFYDHVPGLSYIFEHIAVKATEDVCPEGYVRGNSSYVKTFKCFLEMVKCIRNIHLIFEDEYNKSEIQSSIRRQMPLLMDCVNPYHNLLDLREKVKENFLRTFSSCAGETLKRLNSLQSKGSLQRSDFLNLFMPQPLIYDYQSMIIKAASSSFLVGTANDNILLPKREISRGIQLTSEEKKSVDVILHVIAAMLKAVPPELDDGEKRNTTTTFISKLMNLNTTWSTCYDGGRENKQCTLRIPVGDGKAQYISFDFDK